MVAQGGELKGGHRLVRGQTCPSVLDPDPSYVGNTRAAPGDFVPVAAWVIIPPSYQVAGLPDSNCS